MIKPIASTLVVMSLLLSSSVAYSATAGAGEASRRGASGSTITGATGQSDNERHEDREKERKEREEKRKERREERRDDRKARKDERDARKDEREAHHEHEKAEQAGQAAGQGAQ